jgi:hypothetical protein
MPLKYLLPALQTIAMLLIVWAPWNPKTHEIVARRADGAEFKIRTLIPGLNAFEWVQGINLPAVVVVTPLEFALRKSGDLPSHKVNFYGVWLVGLLCWYMVGRFIDDLVRWRRDRTLPRKNAGDLAFALLVAPSAALVGIAFNAKETGVPVLAAWGIIWIAIASAILLFRVAQVIRQRKRRAVS